MITSNDIFPYIIYNVKSSFEIEMIMFKWWRCILRECFEVPPPKGLSNSSGGGDDIIVVQRLLLELKPLHHHRQQY